MTEAPSNLPAQYRAASRALAALVQINEVKTYRDKAKAMEVYAYQAKDVSLVEPAVTTRKMAERRIGQLMAEQREAGKLAKPGEYRKRVSEKPVSLADQGVDKNLAERSRKAAAMPDEKFDADVKKAVEIAVASITHQADVIKAARAERTQVKKERRQKRVAELAEKIEALPDKKFGVVLADPEWKFETWGEGGMDRAADNHYPTSVLEEIKARNVEALAADDCALFLWATPPMLDAAIEVLKAWGFNYVTNSVWIKPEVGTGYWFRFRHEHLLLGIRGKVPCPSPGDQWELGDGAAARQAQREA